MPCYNNRKLSRRTRGKSCPAGVSFAFRNDIGTPGELRKSKSTNFDLSLEKEENSARGRRQSVPEALRDKLELDGSFEKKRFSHLLNYSTPTGGKGHNDDNVMFCCKLTDAHRPSHSSIGVCNQHTTLNNSSSPAHRSFDIATSFSNHSKLDIAADFDEISNRANFASNNAGVNEKQAEYEVTHAENVNRSTRDDVGNILCLVKASEHSDKTFECREEYSGNQQGRKSNQNQSVFDLYSSGILDDKDVLKKGIDSLLFDLLRAAEQSKETSLNAEERAKYLGNTFVNSLNNKRNEEPSTCEINSTFKEETFQSNFETLEQIRTRNRLSNLHGTSGHRGNISVSRLFQEIRSLEGLDSEARWSELIADSAAFSQSDFSRLESHIEGTERLVENLANQVEETKNDIEMSKQKQENEISDLISLNEEIQTIVSAKDTEVREILEKFSAYRDAVEADSKEKDEMYSEEINKRDTLIKELHLTKESLEDELTRQTSAFRELLDDVRNFDASQVEELGDVSQLVTRLLETFSDQDATVVCQSISLKLETSIATVKEKDYVRYGDDFRDDLIYLIHTLFVV